MTEAQIVDSIRRIRDAVRGLRSPDKWTRPEVGMKHLMQLEDQLRHLYVAAKGRLLGASAGTDR